MPLKCLLHRLFLFFTVSTGVFKGQQPGVKMSGQYIGWRPVREEGLVE